MSSGQHHIQDHTITSQTYILFIYFVVEMVDEAYQKDLMIQFKFKQIMFVTFVNSQYKIQLSVRNMVSKPCGYGEWASDQPKQKKFWLS